MLHLLAESLESHAPAAVALDLFDRLRLREPLARAFAVLGYEGEESWRAAARIKVGLLVDAGMGREAAAESQAASEIAEGAADAGVLQPRESAPAGDASLEETRGKQPEPVLPSSQAEEEKPGPGVPPGLWADPDVRWLCGIHEADGHSCAIRERYEELLWWLLMPSLLDVAAHAAPDRARVAELNRQVDAALAELEAVGYRVDELMPKPIAAEPIAANIVKTGAPETAGESARP